MRKLAFVIALVFGVIGLANSQQKDSTNAAARTATESGRSKIRIEELPEPVKQALEDEKFKGWMINAAFHNEKKDRFEIELKNGVEKQNVKFNKDGKRLDD